MHIMTSVAIARAGAAKKSRSVFLTTGNSWPILPMVVRRTHDFDRAMLCSS